MRTTVQNGKLVNEAGQIAVAVSYGFGAGWSTWCEVSPLNPTYNALILAEDWETAEQLAEEDGFCSGGLRDCIIEWVEPGTEFLIEEYDDSESLIFKSQTNYLQA